MSAGGRGQGEEWAGARAPPGAEGLGAPETYGAVQVCAVCRQCSPPTPVVCVCTPSRHPVALRVAAHRGVQACDSRAWGCAEHQAANWDQTCWCWGPQGPSPGEGLDPAPA